MERLNLVQRWLGHAQLSTTASYANAIGAEERNMVLSQSLRPAERNPLL